MIVSEAIPQKVSPIPRTIMTECTKLATYELARFVFPSPSHCADIWWFRLLIDGNPGPLL